MKLPISILFTTLAIAHTSTGLAAQDSSPIVKCELKEDGWAVKVSIDSLGRAETKIRAPKSATESSCEMSIEDVSHQPAARMPYARFDLKLGTCKPELGKIEDQILKAEVLIIQLINPKKPTARLQWHTGKDLGECKTATYKDLDVKLGAERFKSGQWGKSKVK